ncbi:MAG: TonB family protein [Xanthomonadaceae bacterium]|nr:TonB family protein [Xanthomonadaceae bacterium]
MIEKKHTIYFFLLLSLLAHLGLFYHYRYWSPAVNLKNFTHPEKEQIPVSIIELPPRKKSPKKLREKPINPRFLAEKNRRAEHETRLKKQIPDSGPDRVSRPATPPPAPKRSVIARPKPAVKPAPKDRKQVAKEPEKTVASKPRQPMGKIPITKQSKALQEARSSVSKRKTPEVKPQSKAAKKLFPSYDELTQISRESARKQRASKLPEDIDSGKNIQLNTERFKFHSYYINLKRKIELVWEYPYLARESGLQGRLLMRFVINRDGSLAEAKVLRSSGFALLDQEAIRAVHDASPFPPLPARMNTERLVINATFEYSLGYKTIH